MRMREEVLLLVLTPIILLSSATAAVTATVWAFPFTQNTVGTCQPDLFSYPQGTTLGNILAISKREPVLGIFNPSMQTLNVPVSTAISPTGNVNAKLLIGIAAARTTIAGMRLTAAEPRIILMIIGAPNGNDVQAGPGSLVTKVYSFSIRSPNDVNATYISTPIAPTSIQSAHDLLKSIVQVDCNRGGAILFTWLPFFDTFQRSLIATSSSPTITTPHSNTIVHTLPSPATPPGSNTPAATSNVPSQPECEPGYHWDSSQKQCVPN
jgi:hypothetical protein